jgi:hypothetical protein
MSASCDQPFKKEVEIDTEWHYESNFIVPFLIPPAGVRKWRPNYENDRRGTGYGVGGKAGI